MPIDWADEPAPIEQLQSEAELLRLVHYWRTEAERLASDYAWLVSERKWRKQTKSQ